MKINLPSYQAIQDIPKELLELWRSVGLLTETLRTAFQNRISLGDNLEHLNITAPFAHGVETSLAHGLRRVPTGVVLTSGRVEFWEVLTQDATQVTLRFRLLTTQASAGPAGVLTPTLTTPDARFFREKDVVTVGGRTATVVRAGETTLTLDQRILGGPAVQVNLAVEDVKLLIL